MVGRVAGRVHGSDGHASEAHLLVGVQRIGGRAGEGLELARAGDEVVVGVSVQRAGDLEAELLGMRQVLVDVTHRVDDDRLLRVGIRDHEAGIAQLLRLEGLNCEHPGK